MADNSAWLDQMDAQQAPAPAPTPAPAPAPLLPRPGYRANGNTTEWYDPTGQFPTPTNMNTPEAQRRYSAWAASQQPDAKGGDGWIDQLDAQQGAQGTAGVPAAADTPPVGHLTEKPSGNKLDDAANFVRTMATKAVAGIAGLPGDINQAGEAVAGALGAPDLFPGDKQPTLFGQVMGTGTDPTTTQSEDTLFNHTLPEYQPQTTFGRYAMAAGAPALTALIDPATIGPNALRLGAAGIASQGAQDLGLPGWYGPAGTLLAEFLARGGFHGVISPHTAASQEGRAASTVAELPTVPASAKATFPGMQLTTGQVGGDPQWLALDRDALSGDADLQARAGENLDTNRAIISHHLNTIARGAGGADASVAQADTLSAAREAAFQQKEDAYAAIAPDVSVRTGPLKTELSRHIQGVTENGDSDLIPSNITDQIAAMPDTVPLNRLRARRSRLLTQARDLRRGSNPDTNRARVTSGVADIVDKHLNNEANLVTGNSADLAAVRRANALEKKFNATYGDDGKAGVSLDKVTSGKIAPESALARQLPPGNEGSGARSLAKLKKGVGTGAGLNPARDYLINKLRVAAHSSLGDFDKVLNDYRYAFKDGAMFTKDQQALLGQARDAVEQTYRQASGSVSINSPSLKKLQSPNFAHFIFGKVVGHVGPLLGKMLAAGATSHVAEMAGVPAGMSELAGPLVGAEAAGEAIKNSFEGARDRIMDIVERARTDHVFARQLQMKASAANVKLAPSVRKQLANLGLSATLQGLPGGNPADEGD